MGVSVSAEWTLSFNWTRGGQVQTDATFRRRVGVGGAIELIGHLDVVKFVPHETVVLVVIRVVVCKDLKMSEGGSSGIAQKRGGALGPSEINDGKEARKREEERERHPRIRSIWASRPSFIDHLVDLRRQICKTLGSPSKSEGIRQDQVLLILHVPNVVQEATKFPRIPERAVCRVLTRDGREGEAHANEEAIL